MREIFNDLEKLGFSNIVDIDIYGNDKEKERKRREEEAKNKEAEVDPKELEAEYVYDKKYVCPVCDKEFFSKTVKTGKARLLKTDTDLRPKYIGIDPLKYDVIACTHCGYAGIARSFQGLTSLQIRFLKQQVQAQFRGLPQEGPILNYDEAITRYKLALLSSIVKRAKTSERAYICLKLAWLHRGKAEELEESSASDLDLHAKLEDIKREEHDFIVKAYEGFQAAVQSEMFPICGMDERTFDYLLAELARQSGDLGVAKKLLGNVISSKNISHTLKDKAMALKEMIINEDKKAH